MSTVGETDAGRELRVEVLGPLRAWRGTREISLGPPRQCAVFAGLAMSAGRPVGRDELIKAVWGDFPPASAEGNLHTYVSRLRRALDPARSHRGSTSLLVSDTAGYAIRIRSSNLDLEVFEHACAEAGRVAEEDLASALRSLDAALALWHGEALSGVPGPFAELERERLAQLRMAAVERRAAAALELGGHHELCAELAGLVQENPVRESLRELLMLALYRSGRHTESLEVFREARRELVRELGIEPGEGLRRLHEQVLAFDPALDPPAAAARRAEDAGPDAASSFVGRAAEVERLRDLVAGLTDGRGGTLWIQGEPGIGKTELLAVSLSTVDDLGCQVASGTCPAGGSTLAALRAALGIVADPATPVPAVADRLVSHVDERCATSPLVLVIDDAQWIDEAGLDVVRRLTALTRQLPLLLVVAARPLSCDLALTRLRDRMDVGGGAFLRLRPLPETHAVELAARLVGAQPGPRLTALVARAAGSPWYIKETLRILTGDGTIRRNGRVAELPGSADVVPPESLLNAVDDRLGYLSAATRAMLDRAALLGIEFTAPDLATVSGMRPAELARSVEEALDAGILVDAGEHLEFRQSLVHEVCHGPPGPARDAAHVAAARALADAGVPAPRVARQLVAAPAATPSWLVEWLGAHHRVLVNRDPEVAADLLRRGVSRLEEHGPHREALLVALVRVLVRLDRAPEEPARAALVEVTDPALRVEVRELLATVVHRRGDTVAAAELLESAMAEPGASDAARARLRRRLAELRLGGPDLSTLERAARAALRRGADDPFAADAHHALWTVCSARGDHRRALHHLDRALVLSREDPGTRLSLLENRVRTLHDRDELAEAERTLAEAVERPAGLRVAAAAHHYWTGRWDDALVELDLMPEDGVPGDAILLRHGIAALIAARRDDADRAAAHLDAAADRAPAAERDAVDFLLAARSALAEGEGDVYSALRPLMPLVRHEPARRTSAAPWLPRFIRLAMSAGDADLVARALAVCEKDAAREVPAARAFAAAEWSRGLVLGHAAGVLRAAECYRAAARRPELASALEDAAVLLGAAGAAGSAAARDESLAIHAELAAGLDLRRARDRFGSGPHAQPVRAGDAVRAHVAEVLGRLDSSADVAEGTRP